MIEFEPGRYSVDQFGVVYSLRNNAGNTRTVPLPLKSRLARNGYEVVSLFVERDGNTKYVFKTIHRIVAKAYVGNPNNLPFVNHIDGVKTNNNASNLEWVTASENMQHAFKTGLWKPVTPSKKGDINEKCPNSKPVHQIDENGKIVRTWPSLAEAARNGFSQGNISAVLVGKRRHHRGFLWKYA